MFTPDLKAGIEQRRIFCTQWIDPNHEIGFITVASVAGKRKIVEIAGTPLGLWSDVLHLEREIENVLRGAAVLTTRLRSLCNA